MHYFVAYAFRTGAFYLVLPAAGALLSTEEVGRYFLYLGVINLTSVGATLGLGAYVTRKAYNFRICDYLFASTTGVATLLHAMAALAAATVSWNWLVLVLLSWIRSCALVGEVFLVARGAQRSLIGLNIAYGCVFLSLATVLTWWLRSAEALLVAMALADLPFVLAAISKATGTRKRCWSAALAPGRAQRCFPVLKRGVVYGAPMLVASLANVGLNTMDRFVIEHFWGYASLAAFLMMYTLAFSGNRFIVQPVNQLTAQAYMREAGAEQAKALSRRRSTFAFIFIAAFVLGCATFGNHLLGMMSAEYRVDPLNYVLVGLSTMFAMAFAVCTLPMKRGGRTLALSVRLSAAAALNVLGSLLLVPYVGILGASISTFVAYATLFLSAWQGQGREMVDDRVFLAALLFGLLLVVVVR